MQPENNSSDNTKLGSGYQVPRYLAGKKLKPYMRKKYSSNSSLNIENYPELTVMKQLDHPNLMSIREIIQDNKTYETVHYIMMDLGIPLMELAKHKEVMLVYEQMREITRQLIEGLSYMHEKGFMHRDIKPSNIYMMADGTTRLGDFSISRPIKNAHAEGTESEESQEKTGNVTTRQYKAP